MVEQQVSWEKFCLVVGLELELELGLVDSWELELELELDGMFGRELGLVELVGMIGQGRVGGRLGLVEGGDVELEQVEILVLVVDKLVVRVVEVKPCHLV